VYARYARDVDNYLGKAVTNLVTYAIDCGNP